MNSPCFAGAGFESVKDHILRSIEALVSQVSADLVGDSIDQRFVISPDCSPGILASIIRRDYVTYCTLSFNRGQVENERISTNYQSADHDTD
jgi:hypothetical protein